MPLPRSHSSSVAMESNIYETLMASPVPQVVRRMATELIDGEAKEGKETGEEFIYRRGSASLSI